MSKYRSMIYVICQTIFGSFVTDSLIFRIFPQLGPGVLLVAPGWVPAAQRASGQLTQAPSQRDIPPAGGWPGVGLPRTPGEGLQGGGASLQPPPSLPPQSGGLSQARGRMFGRPQPTWVGGGLLTAGEVLIGGPNLPGREASPGLSRMDGGGAWASSWGCGVGLGREVMGPWPREARPG